MKKRCKRRRGRRNKEHTRVHNETMLHEETRKDDKGKGRIILRE